MREIKFRAWKGEIDRFGKWLVMPEMIYDEHPGDCLMWEMHQNIEAVMQFTGLKDKNGKEIYEGDIVKDNYAEILEVQFGGFYEYAGFGISRKRKKDDEYDTGSDPTWDDLSPMCSKSLEVIGNIYENPELTDRTSCAQGSATRDTTESAEYSNQHGNAKMPRVDV